MRQRCRRAQKKIAGETRWGPNLDRLTVGVDLGDRWSQYCIHWLEGETLAEGQLRTTQEDVGEFFQAMTAARVVIEVGTHSAWVQDVITEWGHEVLVVNPRLARMTQLAVALALVHPEVDCAGLALYSPRRRLDKSRRQDDLAWPFLITFSPVAINTQHFLRWELLPMTLSMLRANLHSRR
jgi:hypothetical protein